MDLNIPELLRRAKSRAEEKPRHETDIPSVSIIVSESDKDAFISALSDTRFAQENWNGSVVPIPNEFTVNFNPTGFFVEPQPVCFKFESSDQLESGTVIID